ncbi:Protein fantom [Cichlidogyrus casuarinus]|uniref:Protein fantom n=1 Tax=Cichlidogyrus casuarinus TaxID=1844966 RepID=A0ABD2Q8R7_9PLAT
MAAAAQNLAIRQWTREDLEDKYMRLYEDNLVLKKHSVEQDDKIKKLSAKINKLTSDYARGGGAKSLDIANLEQKIQKLESENLNLKNRIKLGNEQIKSLRGKRTESTSGKRQTPGGSPSRSNLSDADIRAQNTALEQAIKHLANQNKENEDTIKQLKSNESTQKEEINRLVQAASVRQKSVLEENIALISAQRELRESKNNLTISEQKLQDAESKIEKLKESSLQLAQELERFSKESKEREQQFNLLQASTDQKGSSRLKILELQTKLNELQVSLQVAEERAAKAEKELDLRRQVQKPVNSSLTVEEFGKAVGFESKDIEEALQILRERKSQKNQEVMMKENLHVFNRIQDKSATDSAVRLKELQSLHLETVEELEKTRRLLVVQYRLNTEYKSETKLMAERMGLVQADSNQKLSEYARLLDNKSEHIRRLELKLKDLAYGTYASSKMQDLGVRPPLFVEESISSIRNGTNMIEVHLGKFFLNQQAIKFLSSGIGAKENFDPQSLQFFFIWDFFDYETQTTAVLSGTTIDFNITVQYLIQMDDVTLHYLHRVSLKF